MNTDAAPPEQQRALPGPERGLGRGFWLGLGLALLVLAADQASKAWLIGLMAENPGGIEVTPFFDLVMFWNRGVSFGLLRDDGDLRRWLLIAISAAITLWLLIWLWRGPRRLAAIALGLVIGGAIGNIIDRLRFGAVADFFYFHVGPYYWPAFNVADSAIVCGVGLLLLDGLFEPKSG